MSKRTRDPRLDPRVGDTVRNRKHKPSYRTITGIFPPGLIAYSCARGKAMHFMTPAEWGDFIIGAEVIKRAK